MLAEEILAAAKPREEKVVVAGRQLVVRELAMAADVGAMADGEDMNYKLLVRCVFDEAGAAVFTDADIPAIKAAAKLAFLPLVQAVSRVNGLDVEAEAKNSAAAPA